MLLVAGAFAGRQALQALGVERVRRQQSHAPPELVEEMYHAQLDLVVDLCQLEMHSGHTEMMVARVQVRGER